MVYMSFGSTFSDHMTTFYEIHYLPLFSVLQRNHGNLLYHRGPISSACSQITNVDIDIEIDIKTRNAEKNTLLRTRICISIDVPTWCDAPIGQP